MDFGLFIINTNRLDNKPGDEFISCIGGNTTMDHPFYPEIPLYGKISDNKEGSLHFFIKIGPFDIKTILPRIFPKITHIEILGYIFIVDCNLLTYNQPSQTLYDYQGKKQVYSEIEDFQKRRFFVEDAYKEIQQFRSIAPNAYYVIGAINYDNPSSISFDELRINLKLPISIQIIQLNPTDKYSIKNILTQIVHYIQDSEKVIKIRKLIDKI